jgi:choline transport protein
VDSRTSIPFAAILTTCVISLLLLLIYLGSPLALSDMISLSINSFYGSYFISAAILLYRRLKGQIRERSDETDSLNSTSVNGTSRTVISSRRQVSADDLTMELVWGPWRVRGWLGTLNNIFACAWMLLVLFFSSWPSIKDVNGASMNYSVLITVFVAGSSAVYYLVWARRSGGYTGPIIETGVHG